MMEWRMEQVEVNISKKGMILVEQKDPLGNENGLVEQGSYQKRTGARSRGDNGRDKASSEAGQRSKRRREDSVWCGSP